MDPQFYFLKYKRIQAPFELINKAIDVGWKCRKYIKWSDVHYSSLSRGILKEVGDDLIDNAQFDPKYYKEISGVFAKVYSWAKDKENPSYDLLPELLPEYEKLQRIIKSGSLRPGLVDQVLFDNNFLIDKIDITDRWALFCAIEIIEYFKSSKRFFNFLTEKKFIIKSKKTDLWIKLASDCIREILGSYCLKPTLMKSNDIAIISLFLSNLELPVEPENIDRSSVHLLPNKPNVLIEEFESDKSIFVRFEYIKGQLIIKKNKSCRIFIEKKSEFLVFQDNVFWQLIGQTLLSQIGKIDVIQSFFTTLGSKLDNVD